MTFRIYFDGEPVLNGWTKRPASWPTREAAQGWLAYWDRLHKSLGHKDEDYEIREHTKGEA
jgi:hypothetical protein